MARLAFRADRVTAVAAAAAFAGQGVVGTCIGLFTAKVIAAVVVLDGPAAAAAVAATIVTDTLFQAVTMVALDLRFRLVEKTTLLIEQELIDAMVGAPGLDLHERPAHLDRVEVLRKQVGVLANTIGALLHNLSLVTGFFTVVGVFVSIHPLLALLPIAGIPAVVCAAKSMNAYQKTLDDTAERQRRSDHLFVLATTPGPAKELRTFGLGREITARHRELLASTHRDLDGVALRWSVATSVCWGTLGIAKVAAVAFIALQAIDGRASVGSVIVAWSMTGPLDSFLRQINDMVGWLFNSLRAAERYVDVLDDAHDLMSNEIPHDPVPAPTALTSAIELHGVSFRYPDTEHDVLHDVTLSLPAGSIVALVGENGAGKSTLIKLLGRYYRPTHGSILVDGIDLTRIDTAAWRQRLSGAFQDHARFEFLAREVVGIGDLKLLDDVPRITEALSRAGGGDLAERLEHGLESPLGKSFEDGTEPSGGQWQQLALGRALLRHDPLLLLLDEPTSALDPEAEHALFEGFAAAARSAADATGAITLLVSHRFSTVRMADLIIVLEGRTVAETGSHHELMSQAGLYAELYTLQARSYQ